MARRSYGSGSLVVCADANGAETWYGLWRTGPRRVKRGLGPKRAPGSRDRFDALPGRGRAAAAHAGTDRPDRQRRAKDRRRGRRSRITAATLRRHLVPHFGECTLDRIELAHVDAYLHAKLATLSAKSVTNHLTFLHGLFGFAVSGVGRRATPSPHPPQLPAQDGREREAARAMHGKDPRVRPLAREQGHHAGREQQPDEQRQAPIGGPRRHNT
jgi:hypothetical protein